MKQSFDTIDFNFETIMRMSTDGYDFCALWRNYLAGCGWTEEEFELEAERRVFPVDRSN